MPASANRDLAASAAFHAATTYVPVPDAPGGPAAHHIRMGTEANLESPFWQEDWSLEPLPFKSYESLPRLALPRDFAPSSVPALEALSTSIAGQSVVDRAALARIGLLSNGLLDRGLTTRSGRVMQYRTAGATGARYHLELYFICGDLPDLAAGVYHYAADEHTLRPLRSGDLRGNIVAATGNEPFLARAPVILAVTSTFWRNAWRYKARAYRHAYWDAGTTLGNVLGIASSLRLPTKLVLGYVDADVNALLDVDGTREAALVLCGIGQSMDGAPAAAGMGRLDLPTRPVSAREVEFPAITAMHAASQLASAEEVVEWRANPLRRDPPPPTGATVQLSPLAADAIAPRSIEQLILARRSTRHYETEVPLGFEAFSTLLSVSANPILADCLAPDAPPLHDTYLIVNSVEGLVPGAYVHHTQRGVVELLREGDFRDSARYLAVKQDYAGDAHVNIYYLTDLAPVLERFGNRGYRLAQLECSLSAGRLHLAAHALGLGAVGSTSYDDEVTAFFSPHAAGKSYMFVTVFGKRRRRSQTGSAD